MPGRPQWPQAASEEQVGGLKGHVAPPSFPSAGQRRELSPSILPLAWLPSALTHQPWPPCPQPGSTAALAPEGKVGPEASGEETLCGVCTALPKSFLLKDDPSQ